MNIYAPSRAEKRQERDAFFTHGLAHLRPASCSDILLAGDFYCVTSPSDCTSTPNLSKALSSIITGFALHDVWETLHQQPPYTHYMNDVATRIDRICVTDPSRKRKQDAKTIVAPFSDHFAVVVRLTYPQQISPRKIRLWKINISILEDNISQHTNATLDQMENDWEILSKQDVMVGSIYKATDTTDLPA